MIQLENLTKTFRDNGRGQRAVVDHISFEVRKGEIFGLLGPNGAGKTTTLRMLATLLKPSSGLARVGGYDVTSQSADVRRRIGFLSGDTGLYHRLTPREILLIFGRLNGMAEDALRARIAEMIEMLQMQTFADTRVDKLSTGMRQRAALARALLHDPPILILDEPTAGLDVPTARTIEEFIVRAKGSGKSVLYSTHVMEEAEYLCDRIAVIDRGVIRILGTMEELKRATGKLRLREIFIALLEPSAEKAATA
ncbi:MAG TPA: ATP-binding cassette domain-containing protein [Bryobacteraceae bacterium]|nr:ATP-binding cassette domain-containing protein [Bryobacteraceae bacterium]